MTHRKHLLLAALCVALLGRCLFPREAEAQSPAQVTESRNLVRKGNALYQVGKFEEARVQYEKAHNLRPRPGTLFNLAQCYRQLKNYPKAIFLYRSYLESAPNASDRSDVEETIEKLRKLQEQEKAAQASPPDPSELKGPPPSVLPKSDASPPPPSFTPSSSDEPRPWYKRWYVWTGVGAVVAGGIVAGVLLGTRSSGNVAIPSSGLGNHSFFGAK